MPVVADWVPKNSHCCHDSFSVVFEFVLVVCARDARLQVGRNVKHGSKDKPRTIAPLGRLL